MCVSPLSTKCSCTQSCICISCPRCSFAHLRCLHHSLRIAGYSGPSQVPQPTCYWKWLSSTWLQHLCSDSPFDDKTHFPSENLKLDLSWAWTWIFFCRCSWLRAMLAQASWQPMHICNSICIALTSSAVEGAVNVARVCRRMSVSWQRANSRQQRPLLGWPQPLITFLALISGLEESLLNDVHICNSISVAAF